MVGLLVAIVGIALLAGSDAPETERAGRLGGNVNLATTWWEYVLLFVVVAASWAGVPFIGATGLTAARWRPARGSSSLTAVVLVATAGGEAGGLLGYGVGNRWGRQLLERPGKHQAGRQKMVEHGEEAYARWGRLAVFFTPAIVSGTAKMRYGQFVLWNLVASFAFRSRSPPRPTGWAGCSPDTTPGRHRRLGGGARGRRAHHRVLHAPPTPGGGPARPSRAPPEGGAADQRGRPRMRPAMMSRWTCEVPPAMPAALLQSH